jgi:hypothetical protein
MEVRIPARFQDNNRKLIPVDNVTIRIEHYDSRTGQIVHDVPDRLMAQLSPSDYEYQYIIPDAMELGNYSVYIKAKVPQDNNKIFEAYENFNVVEQAALATIQDPDQPKQNEQEYVPPKVKYADSSNPVTPATVQGSMYEVADMVVDVENNPVSKVHVNIYTKLDFIPNDPQNVKVASTMTDPEGKWKASLPKGEYVIVYKGIGFRENREYRRI